MKKINCWEFKKCGREPGGDKVSEFGVCPSAAAEVADGINSGSNAGRVCWAVSGTFCQGNVQGSFAMKLGKCTDCDFYKHVRDAEGFNFDIGTDLLPRIYSPEQLAHAYDQLHYYLQNIKDLEVQLVSNEKLASLGQLAAGVAHEINNPMAFVSSNLKSLAKYVVTIKDSFKNLSALTTALAQEADSTAIDSAIRELGTIVQNKKLSFMLGDMEDILIESTEGVQRVKSIIQNLRTISRLDEVALQVVNINECLERSLELAKDTIKDRCRVIREFGELPLLSCRPAELEQVFVNIIKNAAEASADNGEITIRTGTDRNHAIFVQISDTGTGISSDILHKIFDPFFTAKPIGQGTGLGLSVAFGIIKAHNGKIEVKSEPGRGSTFTVRIPTVGQAEKEDPGRAT
ncbi:MAG: hypothetical protein A2521_11115 [Deltaproteobacteria bacterium RIFOXYD12_FULL_57_12]|nr:MAG: hypothetical protein A2521_11115 [Deltaproteobacteria bacterium RIFOXYD12_FULL_57_12]